MPGRLAQRSDGLIDKEFELSMDVLAELTVRPPGLVSDAGLPIAISSVRSWQAFIGASWVFSAWAGGELQRRRRQSFLVCEAESQGRRRS
jgi:hypothetical protein